MKRIYLSALFAMAVLQTAAHAQSIPAVTANASAVITTGNTFQTVLAALAQGAIGRRSLTIENNNATDSCWITVDGGAATKGTAILLLPGGSYARYYPYVPSQAIQATCATTGDTLYVDTQ